MGAPILYYYTTPADERTDLNTDPDPYNHTTVSDMGMLLADLYQCAEYGGGALRAVFPKDITQAECNAMIDTLTRNNTPFLIEAGAPDDTRIAHKHGWVSDVVHRGDHHDRRCRDRLHPQRRLRAGDLFLPPHPTGLGPDVQADGRPL